MRVNNTLLFSPLTRITPAISTTLAEIRLATDKHRKVSLQYKRADGKVSDRVIWPLGLFFWGSVWTLGAWCEKRKDFRIFRLDRINSLAFWMRTCRCKKDKLFRT